MNIPKAIEVLTAGKQHRVLVSNQEWEEAQQLGIEALEFRNKVKGWYPTLFPEPLPSETKD